MPLPTTGNLSLSQVRTEFGALATTPLSAFVRGGAWVPDFPANAGVPVALPISLRQLLGASAAPPVSISNQIIDATAFSPATASATYILEAAGLVKRSINGTQTTIETWLQSGAAADYEVRFTLQAGALSSGSTGVWQALSATRSVGVSRSTIGQATATVLAEIRAIGGTLILDSAQITLTATVETGA